jgi:hypothetical protein
MEDTALATERKIDAEAVVREILNLRDMYAEQHIAESGTAVERVKLDMVEMLIGVGEHHAAKKAEAEAETAEAIS